MKKLVLLFILLSVGKTILCQENAYSHMSEKELMQKLQGSVEDSNRINIQLALGKTRLLNGIDPQKKDTLPLRLANDALHLSEKIGYVHGQGYALLLLSIYYNTRNRKDTALLLSQKSLQLFQRSKDNQGIADADVIIGQHYPIGPQRLDYYWMAYRQFMLAGIKQRAATTLVDIADLLIWLERYPEASAPLHEALGIYRTICYRDLQGLYNLLSLASLRGNDFVTGVKYGILAIRTAEANGDSTLQLCSIYCTAGTVYKKMSNYPMADSLFQKAMHIAQRYNDSNYMAVVAENWNACYQATGKYQQAIDLLKHYVEPDIWANNTDGMLSIRVDYIRCHIGMKRYDLAKQDLVEIRRLDRSLDSADAWKREADGQIAEYYEAIGNYTAAYPLLRPLARTYRQLRSPQNLSHIELLLYIADSATHQYFSAIGHMKRARAIDDSLLTIAKTRQIESLKIEYETEKKDRDLLVKDQNIQLLNKQAQLRESQLRENRTTLHMFIGGSALLLTITLLGYSRYRVKQRSNVQLRVQQQEINEQNNSLQKLLQDKNVLLEEKDDLLTEKNLLLREVHHRVKNNLHLVMSLLESQSAYLEDKPAQTAIAESQSRIQAIALIHQRLYGTANVSSVDMHLYVPELIEHLTHSNGVRQRGIEIRHCIDRIKLDVSQSIPIGIILNEAITNAIKYAFPGKRRGTILVNLKRFPDNHALLEIIDDGVGSPVDDDRPDSMGMILIKGLADQLDGTLSMDSRNGYRISLLFQVAAVEYRLKTSV